MTLHEDDGIDLVGAVFEHRLRQHDLDRILAVLSGAARDELVDKLGALLTRVSALLEVSTRASESLSLDVLLPRLIEILTDALGAERSTLFLHDTDTGELFSRVAQGDAVGEIRIPSDAGLAGAAFTSGEPLLVADAYDDPRFNPEVDRRTGYRTRTVLCAPLKLEGRVIGVTQVLNKRAGEFDDDDLALLEALTAQAASALDNAHLHERVERARRDEARLLDATRAIASELELDTLLAKVVATATEMLDAERSSLFLHDRERDELWSRIAEGISIREIRFPACCGIAGACLASGEIVNIPDAYADERFNSEVDRKSGFRTRSVLCVPVRNKAGESLGVMQVLNKRGGPFGPQDERRIAAFAAQAAIALENAQLFQAVVNERNYNESILRSLSNGVLTLDAAQRVIKANDAVLRILGSTSDTLLGRSAAEIFEAPANAWVLESLDRVVESGEVDLAVDAELELPGDGLASVNLSTVPLVDVGDDAIGYMLVLEDITSEKRMRSTMARYMTKEVADRLIEGGAEALGGRSQVATVLFSDIRNFTGIAERLGPRDTVSMLNEYFTDMIEVVFSRRGILDKYIGDAIMALFGAPFPGDHDADDALAVANEMMRVLRRFNRDRRMAGKLALDIGIGISTGELVAGNIGSPKRMDYTVIGDTVNLAARLEAATKHYGVKVLFSETTADALRVPVRSREIDLIRVKGRQDPVVVYESLDHYDEDDFPHLDETVAEFGRGLRNYFNGEFGRATRHFDRALEFNPSDGPSALYLRRCRHFMQTPPPPGWDGVWTMTSK